MDRGRRSFGASGEAHKTDSVTASRFPSTIASGLVDALESPPPSPALPIGKTQQGLQSSSPPPTPVSPSISGNGSRISWASCWLASGLSPSLSGLETILDDYRGSWTYTTGLLGREEGSNEDASLDCGPPGLRDEGAHDASTAGHALLHSSTQDERPRLF